MPLNGARNDTVHRWTAAYAHAKRPQKNAEGILGGVGVPQHQDLVRPILSEPAVRRKRTTSYSRFR